MNDDDNFEQLVLANKREWNSFWFWRDKPVGERGIARDILEAVGVQVDNLGRSTKTHLIAKQCWTANFLASR